MAVPFASDRKGKRGLLNLSAPHPLEGKRIVYCFPPVWNERRPKDGAKFGVIGKKGEGKRRRTVPQSEGVA